MSDSKAVAVPYIIALVLGVGVLSLAGYWFFSGGKFSGEALSEMSGYTCESQGRTICQDHEVCDGGVLSASDTSRCCSGSCKLPKSFDWRNRHGENWITTVKNQGSAGACRTFAPTGTLEAQINLYYNRLLDLDLSEQIAEDCLFRDFLQDTNICRSREGYDLTFCKTKIWGLPDELCAPYVERMSDFPNSNFCTQQYICADWTSRVWKNEDYILYDIHNDGLYDDVAGKIEVSYPEDIKKYLILNGPMNAGLIGWNHNMVLVGYETNEQGQVVWIFKNSWGPQAGENGYIKTTAKDNVYGLKTEFQNPDHPQGPFIPPLNKSFWPKGFDAIIKCEDKDNDGFCNWGISKSKPSICPNSCKLEKDWDDSDANIGALGKYQ